MAPLAPEDQPYTKVKDFVSNHHDTYPEISPSKADLSGKSVFITGASKGVGRTTAIHFAMAGASKIAIGARSPLAELKPVIKKAAVEAGQPEPQVLALHLDISSEDSVCKAAEAIGASFGGSLDVLINNAGYLEKWPPLPSRTLLNSGGHGSAGGHQIVPGASAYQGSRFATCRFTEFVDQEYGDKGIVAITAHPGGVKTELALDMPEPMHAILTDEPELPADTMVWFSKERRDWLAGRFVSCTWDVKELEGRKKEIVENDLLKFRMKV